MFNVNDIDSESDKKILYDLNSLDIVDYYTLYLKDINSFKLQNILSDMDLEVFSFVIKDKKYYKDNIYDLIDEYTKDMNYENKIYYEINGVKIDAVNLRCNVQNIIDLEKMDIIY